MNRKELVKRASNVLRTNNVRKPVHSQKQVFHISDDDGHTKNFVVKNSSANVLYTADDIEAVLDACIYVIQDALKHGDNVSIRGFGSLGLNYRKARATKHPDTGEPVHIDAHYVPKFVFGNDLRKCAKIYELSINEQKRVPKPCDEEYEESDGE